MKFGEYCKNLDGVVGSVDFSKLKKIFKEVDVIDIPKDSVVFGVYDRLESNIVINNQQHLSEEELFRIAEYLENGE